MDDVTMSIDDDDRFNRLNILDSINYTLFLGEEIWASDRKSTSDSLTSSCYVTVCVHKWPLPQI